ncbi:hypothetical protein ORS3428_21970 [Mesorhizobium sp. ORS 3428]|nr:hypothetical protein ORS3428_21970 [Mesorhizobium sp. ORS 3428]
MFRFAAHKAIRPEVDQSDAEFGALRAAQMAGRLDNGDFDCGRHGGFQQVAAAGRSITQPKHCIDMQAWLAAVVDGDVADGAQYLALLVYMYSAQKFRRSASI